MAIVKVLVEGYTDREKNKVSSSVTLIQDDKINIIVDPGIDRFKLLESLTENGLDPADINYVFLTHTHIDHCALMAFFPSAKIIDDSEICSFDGDFKDHSGKIPDTSIRIISTPGHDQFHCSIILHDNDLGKVAIAGDVFWWWNDEEVLTDQKSLLERNDEYVKDVRQNTQSRQKLLDFSDYIIPGHGKMFKVEK